MPILHIPLRQIKQLQGYSELACFFPYFRVTFTGRLVYDCFKGYYLDKLKSFYCPGSDGWGNL